MKTIATFEHDAPTTLPSTECPICGKQTVAHAGRCTDCGHQFVDAPINTTKGQRIQNFSAWQQVSAGIRRHDTPEARRLRWPYWLGGAVVALICIAVLAYLLLLLPA